MHAVLYLRVTQQCRFDALMQLIELGLGLGWNVAQGSA